MGKINITELKDKRFILGGVCIFLVVLLAIFLFNRLPENAARPDQKFNITAFGNLPDLNQAVQSNARMFDLIQNLLRYDEAFLFVNYGQVNSEVATLMFLWAGIDEITLNKIGSQRAIATFIRRAYGFPEDEPLMGNPLLENNPWGDLFNRFKAQILMQGQGHKIYDGLAYFDNEEDRMVVDANLSKDFIAGFAEFLQTQDSQMRKKYFNNFLLFIRDTKGFNNLSEKDKELLKELSS